MAKLLLIAPTCDGNDVGEAWVAYQWAKRLPELHDVTVLTYHKRGKVPTSEQLPGVRVVEWTEPRLVGRAERLNSMLKPGYTSFYVKARRWIREAIERGETFDIVHQPVPVAMRYPCPATGLGIPVVIGPVGGGLDSPPAFATEEGTAPWFVKLRAVDRFRLRHDPLLRRTYTHAACVVGIAPYVGELLDGVGLRRFEVLSETAIEVMNDVPDRPLPDPSTPLRLLFVGRLVRTKGARDAIRALVLVADQRITLDIVGDGSDRAACEELVDSLRLRGRVRFHGAVPRAEVDSFYERADIFVFPSYREPGGNVVFEAMSHSLPLIVCDRGGPAAAVDETCALVVPAITPAQLAEAVAAAIDALGADPQRRVDMGVAARGRLTEVGLWPAKVRRMTELYESVCSGA